KKSLAHSVLRHPAVLNSPLAAPTLISPFQGFPHPYGHPLTLGQVRACLVRPPWLGVHAHPRCPARGCFVRACRPFVFAETGGDRPRRHPATRQHFLLTFRRFLTS